MSDKVKGPEPAPAVKSVAPDTSVTKTVGSVQAPQVKTGGNVSFYKNVDSVQAPK